MRIALALFIPVAAAIAGIWWWLGAPVSLPPSPLAAGQKYYCISYAPFRGGQTPFDASWRAPAQQIDDDLKTALAAVKVGVPVGGIAVAVGLLAAGAAQAESRTVTRRINRINIRIIRDYTTSGKETSTWQ